MEAREIRIGRLFARGNPVIIACDHGEFDGPIDGLVNFPQTVGRLDPAVDGVLLSPGMINHTGDWFARRGAPLLIGRLNWNTVYCFQWGYREAVSAVAFTAGEALRLGVEIALVSLTLHTGSEERDAHNVAVFRQAVSACHRLGLPVIGEYFPAEPETLDPRRLHDEIRVGCRILAELGADMIKTFHTRDFPAVVAGCPVPIFALGAARLPTARAALALAEKAIADGARGVVFGRNALQVPDPAAFQAALCAVVREGLTAAAAAGRHGLDG